MLSPLIPYTGGKKDSVEMILPHVDYDISCFVEAFCGGIGVSLYLLQTRPFTGEVICSDIDENLIALYNYVKDYPSNFISDVTLSISDKDLTSRLIYEDESNLSFSDYFILKNCIKMVPPYRVVSERALRLYIEKFNADNFTTYITDLHKLLKRITFICCDYKETIQRYNSKGTFFFLDPPYRGGSIKQTNWYNANFIDMGELHNILDNVINCIISYNDCKLVSCIFSDYTKKTKQIYKSHSGTPRCDTYYYK